MAESANQFELKRKLTRILECAMEAARNWAGIYRTGVGYIFGDQLADVTIKDGWEAIQDNMIFPAIAQEQALLNQNRVQIKARPFEEGDRDAAKRWEPIYQWHYESGLKVPEKITAGILDAKTHGHWVGKITWDPRAKWDRKERRWKGAVRLKLVHPELVIFDPDSSDAEETSWVVELEQVSRRALKKRFPQHADDIELQGGLDAKVEDVLGEAKSHIAASMRTDSKGKDPDKQGAIGGELVDLLRPGATGFKPGRDDPDKLWVRNYFIKDDKTEKKDIIDREFTPVELIDTGLAVEGPDPDNPRETILFDVKTGKPMDDAEMHGESRSEDVPVYPSYRHVITMGDIILLDEPWRYDRHPYALGINLPLPHTWHGLNGVQMVRGLQDFINRIAMSNDAYVRYFGSPITKVAENAVWNCTNLTNVNRKIGVGPGAIWKTTMEGFDKVALVPMPPMPPSVDSIRKNTADSVRDQTGIHEIGLGRQTPGATTLGEALRLETNTKLRTALQWLMVQVWILRVMDRTQELCQEHFTEGDMVRIGGEEVGAYQLTGEDFDAAFDLRTELTTELPYDRERRKREAGELYDRLGLPLLEPLLDAYERKDKTEIMSKIKAYQVMLAIEKRLAEQQADVAPQWQNESKSPQGSTQETNNAETEKPQPRAGGS